MEKDLSRKKDIKLDSNMGFKQTPSDYKTPPVDVHGNR